MKSKKPIAELDPVEKSDTTCECSEWLTQSTFVPLYLCMYVRVFAHARTHAGMHTGTHTARARAEANCYKRKSNLANFPLRHNITALDLFMVRRHLLKVERILVSNIQVPGLQKNVSALTKRTEIINHVGACSVQLRAMMREDQAAVLTDLWSVVSTTRACASCGDIAIPNATFSRSASDLAVTFVDGSISHVLDIGT